MKKKEDQLDKREIELATLMEKQKTLNLLNQEIEKRSIYFNNIQSQLVAKTVQAGAVSLTNTKLYSKAVPPLYPESPRKKIILVLFAAFFVFLASVYSYTKLRLNGTIYTRFQLRNFSQIQNKIQLSLSDYNHLSESKKSLSV